MSDPCIPPQAINPNVTTLMYFNTMFNFDMFEFAGRIAALEAVGTRALLRDKHGGLVLLCNDADVYVFGAVLSMTIAPCVPVLLAVDRVC